ncbi:BQ5605_C044g12123 [Microbotryum silenes-dioicae]|uniref:BQ5605_C044g12123 protein n=1 Tax=Microbotryum silenes-dioicae TaxID=796604 RepID=A0A2X0MST2_9BASI|nr:BQ5605_C044g12123 [Microbotryum silenes-dioicae]
MPACRAPGHRLRDCTSRAQHPPTGPCRRCHKKGQHTSSAAQQPNVGYFASCCSLAAILPTDAFVVDSGATTHMVADRSLFTTYRPTTHTKIGGIAAVSRPLAWGMYRLLPTPDTRSRCAAFCTRWAFTSTFSPSLAFVTPTSVRLAFTSDSIDITKDGQAIAHGTRVNDGLYLLDADHTKCQQLAFLSRSESTVPLITLHRCLGHLAPSSIQKMIAAGLLDGFGAGYSDKDVAEFVCNACLWFQGPSSSFSRLGVTFPRETWSRCTAIDVFPTFQTWLAEVELETDARLRILRTDNGGKCEESTLRSAQDLGARSEPGADLGARSEPGAPAQDLGAQSEAGT